MTTTQIGYQILDLWEISKEVATQTGILPFLAIGAGIALVGWGGFAIWSAWQDVQMRRAKERIQL